MDKKVELCHTCGGLGYIYKHVDYQDGYPVYEEKTCKDCGGTGTESDFQGV